MKPHRHGARRRAIAVTRLRLRAYREVVTAIGQPALLVDAGGVVRAVSAEAAALFGQAPRQLEGRAISALLPEWDRLRRRQHHLSHRASDGPSAGGEERTEARRLSGARIPVATAVSSLGAGVIVVTLRDLSLSSAHERHPTLLRDTDELLANADDDEAIISKVVMLATKFLAERCAVHLRDPDGRIHRRLAARVAGDSVVLDRDDAPVDADLPLGAPAVIRTGRSELYHPVPSVLWQAWDCFAEGSEPARTSSVLVVPLRGRGEPRGALTVASPDRVLDGADLAAAEALARRAALALETAELVATLREAIAVRDERLTHLDTILGAIPIGLIICNPNLEVAEMNAVAAEMLGPDAWCGDRRGRLRGPLGEVIEAQVLRVLHSGEAVRGLEIEAPSRDEPRQYALALAPVWRGERIVQVGVVLVDRTTDHQIQQSLRYRLEFEQLLAALSTHFINLPSDRIDDAIEDTLRSVGEFLDVDATEIVLFSADGTLGAVAASWRADGRPVADRSFALADYPWSVGRLQALEPVVVSRVTEIDGEEERLRVMAQGIGSLLSLPLIARGGAIGFLRVATLGRETRWTSLDVAFVRLAAILVVNALDRKRAEASQRESERLTGIGLAAREMAHLIKNDLTGAIGVLELLLESPERLPRYQALMRGALRNLRRAADTVDQLQSVARVATKETAVGLALDLPRSVARD